MTRRRRRSDPLADLYSHVANAAADEALQTGGKVSDEKLEALGRIERLMELVHSAEPQPPRARWPPAAALAATLIIASILLFARVRVTDVDVDVEVSEVSFDVPEQQELTKAIGLAAVGVSGVRDVQLPAAASAGGYQPTSADSDAAVFLAAESAGERHGTIDFAPLIVPAGTRVTVRTTGLPHRFRLVLELPQAETIDLQASVHGPVRIGLVGTPATPIDFATPKAVVLESGAQHVELDWTVPKVPAVPFTLDLSAAQLRLTHVESFADTRRTVVRHASTILGGSLYFQSLNGREQKLRAGERIELTESRGALQTLELRDDRIALRFSGEVRGLTDGSATVRWSLMPTWLAWLQARQGLLLLWSTALYLLGLVTTVLRWWKREE